MQIRSKRDGAVLTARLKSVPYDTHDGSLALMYDTGAGLVSIGLRQAQEDFELVSVSPEERAELERQGYAFGDGG